MKGFLKRLGSAFSAAPAPDDEPQEEPAVEQPPLDQPSEEGDSEPLEHTWNGLSEQGGTVEDYREAFRHGPIGIWASRQDDPEPHGEMVSFMADHTGLTIVWDEAGQEQERTIFEWQPLAERCIRMRFIAAMEAEIEDDSDDVEADGAGDVYDADELEEPEQGEWETVYFDFAAEEQDGVEYISMHRDEEAGFPCGCRYGEGPLYFDWARVRKVREASALKETA